MTIAKTVTPQKALGRALIEETGAKTRAARNGAMRWAALFIAAAERGGHYVSPDGYSVDIEDAGAVVRFSMPSMLTPGTTGSIHTLRNINAFMRYIAHSQHHGS